MSYIAQHNRSKPRNGIRKKSMKRAIYIFLISIVAVLAALVGRKLYTDAKKKAPEREPERFAIAVAMPERKDIADVRRFTGTLKPASSFALAAKVPGTLKKINVSMGDPVKPGSLIAKIDDLEYIQALAQARANLEMGKAQKVEAQIALDQAKREFDRYKTLHDNNVYSDAQLELAQTTLNSQQAVLDMRKADVARLQALFDNAETKLDDTNINADWHSGQRFVAQRHVDAGALLSANQPVATIIDISELKAEISVIERDYPKLSLGHPATITTDAYPGRIFCGNISNIAQNLNETARQAVVRVLIPNPDSALKPGMFIRMEIELARHEGVTVIPREALVRREGAQGVFVYLKDEGNVRFIPVATGLASGNDIEVTSPEALSLPVVIIGNHQLSDGSPVIDPELFEGGDGEA